MAARGTGDADRLLRRRWHAWAVAVAGLAGRRGRHRIDAAGYDLAHRELLRACRERAAATDGPARRYYEELAALAGPWLTTRALEQAGLEILLDLDERCRRIDRELGGDRRWAKLAARGSAAILAALAAGGLLAASRATGAGDWVADLVTDFVATLRFWLRRPTQTQQLLAGGFAVAVVGWLLISYTRRS